MKIIDVHPEELLDREFRGQLSDDQRVLLDAHLTQCESCRLERLLRADFAAEAVRTGEADMQSFVLGALQRAASSESHVAINTAASGAGGSGSRRRMSAMLALACVLLVAAGAAASRSAWVERMFHVTFGDATIESAPVPNAKRSAKQTATAAAPSAAPSAAAVAADAHARGAVVDVQARAPEGLQAVDAERAPKLTPAQIDPPRETKSELSAAPRALENTYRPAPRTARITNVRSSKSALSARAPKTAVAAPAPLAPEPAAVETKPLPPAAPDPARLALQAAAAAQFEQANKARRSGRLDQAATLYDGLQRDFPSSAEARLSYALAARMWLDAGNSYAALGGFDRYLASGERALREEAMTGRALSLERLGRKAAADQAFAELLKAYPYSSYAPLAKKRLGQD